MSLPRVSRGSGITNTAVPGHRQQLDIRPTISHERRLAFRRSGGMSCRRYGHAFVDQDASGDRRTSFRKPEADRGRAVESLNRDGFAARLDRAIARSGVPPMLIEPRDDGTN
jgi:hypothetical protein